MAGNLARKASVDEKIDIPAAINDAWRGLAGLGAKSG
jgi:hypothetical protein